jgi:ubiquitin-protein ligase
MRRLISDYEQVKKDFTGNRYIVVTPLGEEPPERYHVTYFVNGIYMLPDKSVVMLGRHEVEITLHTEYPRYRPVCKILTPIWHPNFRDGQICIGDIWGAGESLSDIIINIGDMIQYKSWNSFSPLSAEAAQWAIEHKNTFPVGTIELRKADYSEAAQKVEIDLLDAEDEPKQEDLAGGTPSGQAPPVTGTPTEEIQPAYPAAVPEPVIENDFEITPEELAGVEFVPSAHRMQSVSQAALVKSRRVNFKTVFVKGLIWALVGALLGFGITEALDSSINETRLLRLGGYDDIADYNDIADEINQMYIDFDNKYADVDFDHLEDVDTVTYNKMMNDYGKIQDKEDEQLDMFIDLVDEYGDTEQYGTAMTTDDVEGLAQSTVDAIGKIQSNAVRLSMALWSAILAMFLGLFLGLGEGIYYGSKGKTALYALIGAGLSLVIGFASGYLAQVLYAELLDEEASMFMSSLVRAAGWAVMGVGVGAAIGLIKPDKRRLLFCILGGLVGAFIGGFLFNYISDAVTLNTADTGTLARGIGVVIMGLLVGLGIGLLEQFAKVAWLKVTRGEFEGKEYLVFSGTTSIGNTGRNTIVLFKDKLVAPNHCDIVLENGRYMLVDKGSPMGTIVNGRRITRHVLKKGDAIAIGNSVLVFSTK